MADYPLTAEKIKTNSNAPAFASSWRCRTV